MAAQRPVSLRSEKTETPAGSRPEERDFSAPDGVPNLHLQNASKHKQGRG